MLIALLWIANPKSLKLDPNTMQAPTILILDQEEVVRDSLSLVLRDEGYRCLASNNPAEVVQLITENYVQIIIVDAKIACHKEIRSIIEKSSPTLKTIILSSYAEIDNSQIHLITKADKLVLKPLDFDELLNAVDGFTSPIDGNKA